MLCLPIGLCVEWPLCFCCLAPRNQHLKELVVVLIPCQLLVGAVLLGIGTVWLDLQHAGPSAGVSSGVSFQLLVPCAGDRLEPGQSHLFCWLVCTGTT